MARKVTIEDVARESDASPTTVSLVLRDKPGIGPDTRKRVLAAAQALGYQRRSPAPVEPGQTVLNVGLVLRSAVRSGGMPLPVVNPFYSWVLTGVEAAARPQRMNLLYATLPVDDDNRPLDLPHHLLTQPLDGVLLIGPFAAETVAAVAGPQAGPVVLVDAPMGAHGYDAVASDNHGGAAAAVDHLVARGHRQIALVGPHPRTDPNFSQRRDGYLQAIRAHGLDDYASQTAPDEIAAATGALLERHPRVTAVIGSNDDVAIRSLRAAQARGRRVPDDLSVIGFDDIELAAEIDPPLTTLAVDKVSMGRLAVQALSHRLAWPEAATVLTVLRPALLERRSVASCGPPGPPDGAA